MEETAILQALQTGAIAAYAASDLAALDGWTNDTRLKPVGITLTPPDDGRYVEFVHLPNNRSGDYWDDARVYQGNFRIILHWQKDEVGPYPPMTYLDQIGSYFKKARVLAAGGLIVKIYEIPSASGPIENGSELLFPVTLPYRCFRP